MLEAFEKDPNFNFTSFGNCGLNVNQSQSVSLLKELHIVGGQPHLRGQLSLGKTPNTTDPGYRSPDFAIKGAFLGGFHATDDYSNRPFKQPLCVPILLSSVELHDLGKGNV